MPLRHENLWIGTRMYELGKEGGLQRVCCESGNRSEQAITVTGSVMKVFTAAMDIDLNMVTKSAYGKGTPNSPLIPPVRKSQKSPLR